jgi:hypothetical protein
LGYFTNAFIIGFFSLLVSIVYFPYIAVFLLLLIPGIVLRVAYEYSIPIVIAYVAILVYLMFKYDRPKLLYLIALAPALYIILNAPMWFALWLTS